VIKVKKISSQVRKNILDLEHNKYVQYYTATVILTTTYFIGLLTLIITESINYNINKLILISIISVGILCSGYFLLAKFRIKMRDIMREIRTLSL
jgi:hypothetical protein